MLEFSEKFVPQLKWTNSQEARKTILLTGTPGAGKTLLAQVLADAIVGAENTFLMDFPEEEGTDTLGDYRTPYFTFTRLADLDTWYPELMKAKPEAIIWDGVPAAYTMFMRERVPSGIPPEDHGKTWMAVATTLRNQLIRFKMIPSVRVFVGTSLVWPDKDEITGKEGRIQVTLPGQLKANIYGLFSYDLNIALEAQPDGKSVRVLEIQPTARTVARVRAPLSARIQARFSYDLQDAKNPGMLSKEVVSSILSVLRLSPNQAAKEA